MTTRPCRYCHTEVTSTNPDVDYCMWCYYDGTSQRAPFTELIDAINEFGARAYIHHTGGGCFALRIDVPRPDYPNIYLLATDTDGGALPDGPDGPWYVCRYDDDERYCDSDGTELAEACDADWLLNHTVAHEIVEARS
jgi:hypothetical protein